MAFTLAREAASGITTVQSTSSRPAAYLAGELDRHLQLAAGGRLYRADRETGDVEDRVVILLGAVDVEELAKVATTVERTSG